MWKVQFAINIKLAGECLNNEDTIGNVTKGRVIRLSDNEVRNAISGNMINHVFVRNLRGYSNKDELCSTCRIFSPMKNGKLFIEDDKSLSKTGNRVKACIIDDVCGLMNAGKDKDGNSHNEKRNKVVNWSWGIAREGVSDSALYNRVDPTEKNNKKKEDDTTSDANTNSKQNTQMIFHRPIRSSEYSIMCQMDFARISFDDEKLKYVVNDVDFIKERIKKVIMAFRDTILDIRGALCSTNMPHLLSVDGVLTQKLSAQELISKYSPMNEDYKEVHNELSNCIEFNTPVEFSKVVDLLLDDEYLNTIIERNIKYIEKAFN
ncbi:DevR family CRISPR-associated autoregulator [Clostridium perfringens]